MEVIDNTQEQLSLFGHQMALIPENKYETIYRGYEIHLTLEEAAMLYKQKTGHWPTKAIVPLNYKTGKIPASMTVEPTKKQTYMILLTHDFALWGGVKDQRTLNDRRIKAGTAEQSGN